MTVSFLGQNRVLGGNAWERGTCGWTCPRGDPSEGIKWRQWTGGGNKAVYCHRWGRARVAVEVVGPAGGTSGVQSGAPSGPCLRALAIIDCTCLHVSTVQRLRPQESNWCTQFKDTPSVKLSAMGAIYIFGFTNSTDTNIVFFGVRF